jgi:STE24 endopeptidase
MNAAALWIIPGAAAALVLGAVLAGLLFPGAPPDPATLRYFEPGFLARAGAYQRAGLSVFLARQALLLAFLAAAAGAALRYFRDRPSPPVPAAAAWIGLVLILFQLLNLPLDYYRGFVVEHRFGFSTLTPGGWFLDYGKAALINLLISAAGLTGLYFLLLRRPAHWWIAAGAVLALFLLLSSYLYPLLIDPLFYRFSAPEDEALNGAILAMADRAGIPVEKVLVADASRRTRKVNAYFTGLGRTKRIVLFDTLLESFRREEVLAVVAHEMGHWRHQHILKGIALGALGGLIAFYLFQLLLQGMGIAPGFRALPLALLFLALLSLAAMPAGNALSRSFEREADRTSLELAADPGAFISLKQKIALANLAVVRPHPLLKFTLYSHPPVMERIEMALEKN